MAKTIKFNLICNQNSIRNIEDLRNNFVIEDVLEYYKNGLLLCWLKVRGYTEEYEKVNDIKEDDDSILIKKLIKIFNIEIENLEESIYILTYLKERKRILDNYKNLNNNMKKTIEEYMNEYKLYVEDIVEHKDNISNIRANLKEINKNYNYILAFDYRNLFYKFLFEAPKAIFVMLSIEGMRELYLPNVTCRNYMICHNCRSYNTCECDEIAIHDKCNGCDKYEECKCADFYLNINTYDKKINQDNVDIFNSIEEIMNNDSYVNILEENLKSFEGDTYEYWKDIEPKGKKFMILKMEGKSFVRSSGTSGEEFGEDDINNKFVILDGIDFKGKESSKLVYMEV